jgi:hypothetical protein
VLPSARCMSTSQPMMASCGLLLAVSITREQCGGRIVSSESKNITHGVVTASRPLLRAAAAPGVSQSSTRMVKSGASSADCQRVSSSRVPSVELLSTRIISSGLAVCASSECRVRPTSSFLLCAGMIMVRNFSIVQYALAPNMAVPTRTRFAPASMASG